MILFLYDYDAKLSEKLFHVFAFCKTIMCIIIRKVHKVHIANWRDPSVHTLNMKNLTIPSPFQPTWPYRIITSFKRWRTLVMLKIIQCFLLAWLECFKEHWILDVYDVIYVMTTRQMTFQNAVLKWRYGDVLVVIG